MNPAAPPFLGVGLGFRPELETQIFQNRESIDWLEVISEHYLGRPAARLEQVTRLREAFVLVPHGVELSIGTSGEPDGAYVDALAAFVDQINAPWFSDHLCFTRADGIALGQLIPLARTRELAVEVGRKAHWIQRAVGRPFLLENITYYFDLDTGMSEAEFITEVLERGDCGLLLDLTNAYTNASNHGSDPLDFLRAIPMERVVQIHLAGGTQGGDVLLDSHNSAVPPEVFDLLKAACEMAPNLKGVMIERDQDYPEDFAELARDLVTARAIFGGPR